MDIADLRDFCLSFDDVAEKTPFGKFSPKFDSILVFYVLGHMFCLTDMDNFRSVSIRLDSEKIEELRQRYRSVDYPLNLNRKYWVSIELGGDIPDSVVRTLVAESYANVRRRHTPRRRGK